MADVEVILDFWSERFCLLLIYKSPRYFLPSSKSISLSVQEKKFKIDFQDGVRSSHFGFLNVTILAIFDLYVAPIPPTKFRVN